MTAKKTVNIAVLGDGGVGKTAFLTRLNTGDFIKPYVATIGRSIVDIDNLRFTEFSGQEKYCWGEHRLSGFDFYIIMFDRTSKLSFMGTDHWYNLVEGFGKPIILIGNKIDCRELKVKPVSICKIKGKYTTYIDFSVKSCYNISKVYDILGYEPEPIELDL